MGKLGRAFKTWSVPDSVRATVLQSDAAARAALQRAIQQKQQKGSN